MTIRAQILLIVLACITVFFPTFSAEICSIDDTLLVKTLENGHVPNPVEIFSSQHNNTLYFRPLLGVTFWIDSYFFHVSRFWMHLENVLIHLGSMLLIFFIGRRLFKEDKSSTTYFALFTALLWGLHPLTTESVCWVSGRTDLLAGVFIFAATLLILHFKLSKKVFILFWAAFASLLAMLSKEVAVAFFPGALLILFSYRSKAQQAIGVNFKKKFSLFFYGLIPLIPLLAFFLIRSAGSISDSSRIGITLQYMNINPIQSMMLFSRALGFYVSKIFYPWPLNLAIREVDPLFDLLAIPILFLCAWLLWNRSLLATFFLTGICLLTPSFVIALNQIAWTPFAERYVYVGMAFILLAIVGVIAKFPLSKFKAAYPWLGTSVLLIFSVSTFYRSNTWRTNLGILEDTAVKSPDSKKIQWVYGGALSNLGFHRKALEVTKRACSLPSPPMTTDITPLLNLGNIYANLSQFENAITIFNIVIDKSDCNSSLARQGLVEAYFLKTRAVDDPNLRKKSYSEAENYSTLLFKQTRDPFILYNLGKLSLELDKKNKAKSYFRKAYNAFPGDSPYKKYAEKLSLK